MKFRIYSDGMVIDENEITDLENPPPSDISSELVDVPDLIFEHICDSIEGK